MSSVATLDGAEGGPEGWRCCGGSAAWALETAQGGRLWCEFAPEDESSGFRAGRFGLLRGPSLDGGSQTSGSRGGGPSWRASIGASRGSKIWIWGSPKRLGSLLPAPFVGALSARGRASKRGLGGGRAREAADPGCAGTRAERRKSTTSVCRVMYSVACD